MEMRAGETLSYISSSNLTFANLNRILKNKNIFVTRHTFCGTWYLPHSHVHNERTVPIIMTGYMAQEREGYISTCGLKSDVTIVFLDPDFF